MKAEEKEKSEDRKLIDEVYANCLAAIKVADEQWEKTTEQKEKDEIRSVRDGIVRENLLKIMKVLQERIPAHLKEKVMKTLSFDGPLYRTIHTATDHENMMTNYGCHVFKNSKPLIVVNYGLVKEELMQLAEAWKPFVWTNGLFTGFPTLPRTEPLPDKKIRIKDGKITLGKIKVFIQNLPMETTISIYGIDISPVLDWKCLAKEITYEDNKAFMTSYHSPQDKSPTVTVGDLQKEISDKSSDMEFFILLENHEEHGPLEICTFEYYSERSELQIDVLSI